MSRDYKSNTAMNKKIIILMLVTLLPFCAISKKGPKIRFEKEEYNFGKIAQGSNGTCEFVVWNDGKDVLNISVRSSCGCMSVTPRTIEGIKPGERKTITAKYNTNLIGDFRKFIYVTSNDENNPKVTLTVTGTVDGAPIANNNNKAEKQRDNMMDARVMGSQTVDGKNRTRGNAPAIVRSETKIIVGNYIGNRGEVCGEVKDKTIWLCAGYSETDNAIVFSLEGEPVSNGYVKRDKFNVTLGNGLFLRCYDNTLLKLDIGKYDENDLFVTSVSTTECYPSPWGPKWEVNKHTFTKKLSIDYLAMNANYKYKKALKGSLSEEIDYMKVCPYDDHRTDMENDIVNNKINNVEDLVYVLENYPSIKYRLVEKIAKFDDEVFQSLHRNYSIEKYDFYLNTFPNGKHVTDVKNWKEEHLLYLKADKGGIPECAAYLAKYPNGRFVNQTRSKKERLEQINANSNTATWKMGNKICYCNSDGITMVTLDQWNEDKSSFKGIVIASPGGLYEGSILQKGNQLWLEPKGWHQCLEDEITFALNNDRSAEAEQLLKTKNMKFNRGTLVSKTFYYNSWLVHSTYHVQAKVEDWNEDYTLMKIQIVKTDGCEYINGESIYNGKYLWVSPIGWN